MFAPPLSKRSASIRPGSAIGVPVNGVEPPPLDTVTVVDDDVLLPAASKAVAPSVCVPFVTVVVSQESEYGAAVSSAPSGAPSRRNRTAATPTLSDAVAATVIDPDTDAPDAGDVSATTGGVWSGGGVGGSPGVYEPRYGASRRSLLEMSRQSPSQISRNR
jgi:hypothetical protein